MKRNELLILTGMSGAGRSTVAHSLEDLGWYVVDNLPPSLLPALAKQSSEGELPALAVVVDGGKPQVSAAQRALSELGITDIALCGLAKRIEEVWLPNNADPLIFPRNSEGLYLLQRIRDEAHRFAITFHRSRRSKVMLESLLDEITW